MLNALPLLGDAPFIAVNGDIWCDFDFSTLPQNPHGVAHLMMVDNPPHHRVGDFVLREGLLFDEQSPRLTFAGIGVYRPSLVADHAPGIFGITPLLRAEMRLGGVSGEHYRGQWMDVGTPQRLQELDDRLLTKRP